MNKIRFIYIFCIGVMLCIFGIFCLPFPYPDSSSEEVAIDRLLASVSKLSMGGGVVVVLVSIVGGIIKAANKYFATSTSMVFVGIAFLVLGSLYGSFVALPIPNPPPDGMQWAVHVFVSLTLLLAGSALLLLFIFRKIVASNAVRRTRQ
jgi:hypothetical protein